MKANPTTAHLITAIETIGQRLREFNDATIQAKGHTFDCLVDAILAGDKLIKYQIDFTPETGFTLDGVSIGNGVAVFLVKSGTPSNWNEASWVEVSRLLSLEPLPAVEKVSYVETHYILPASWVHYLVDGDDSTIPDEAKEKADAWLEDHPNEQAQKAGPEDQHGFKKYTFIKQIVA